MKEGLEILSYPPKLPGQEVLCIVHSLCFPLLRLLITSIDSYPMARCSKVHNPIMYEINNTYGHDYNMLIKLINMIFDL